MVEVIKLFKQIQETSSLNDKKAIIIANKNNELFKECLKFLLDGNIVTGISNSKISKVNKNTTKDKATIKLNSFKEVMEYLQVHNTGRDEDIANVKSFIYDHYIVDDDEFMFYVQMVTKKYRLGADAKLVNKCIPGLIPTFDVMLGTSIDKVKLKGNEWISISRKLNGCFSENTKVIMGNGDVKRISDIKVGDKVMSFNEDSNEISQQVVTNVFYNGKKPIDSWLHISFDSWRNKKKKTIEVTKNHKIFTPNGWKEAQQLKINDEVYSYDYELSETQRQVLLGIGLGDGSVKFDNLEYNSVRFIYPKKEESYRDYFYNVINLFDLYSGTISNRTSGYGTPMLRGTIKSITSLPDIYYNQDNIIKESYTFTEEILNEISPLALAIYYIDDGSKLPSRMDGYDYCSNLYPRVTFATHRHRYENVKLFSEYLYDKYNIENRVVKYNTNDDRDMMYQIELTSKGTIIFFDLIAKYIPYNLRPSKLGKDWINVPYEDWTKNYGKYVLAKKKIDNVVECTELGRYKHGQKYIKSYDIEVANNHTYFANSYAVHNCRCAFIGEKCMTRQGKEYKGIDHIIKDLHSLGLKNCFVDGELLYKNEECLSDSEAFQKGTGIAMSKDADKSDLKLVIFDVFPLEEFWNGKSKASYRERNQTLLEIKDDIELFGDVENVEIVQMCYEGTNHTEIWKWLDYAEENDWEGIMLNLDTPYECKRTKNLIKVKKFFSCDIKCTGIEEGSGRNKGSLGALICDYKGNKVNVGTGFSDKVREQIWHHPEDVIGKIITVKYKEETKNKDGGLSIQFPVFETIRFDKNKPSYN